MARPTEERKEVRMQILLPPSLVTKLDDYRAGRRPVLTRSEAVRELVGIGLEKVSGGAERVA